MEAGRIRLQFSFDTLDSIKAAKEKSILEAKRIIENAAKFDGSIELGDETLDEMTEEKQIDAIKKTYKEKIVNDIDKDLINLSDAEVIYINFFFNIYYIYIYTYVIHMCI